MQRLSDAELNVMKVLWRSDGGTAAPTENYTEFTLGEIVEGLKSTMGWRRNTVHTYLTRMERKGLVKINRTGEPHRYGAAVSRDVCAEQERHNLRKRFYEDAVADLIAAYLKESPLSEEERNRLCQLLNETPASPSSAGPSPASPSSAGPSPEHSSSDCPTPEFILEIPEYVQCILGKLTDAGHEAYVVGGCVRDALMGKEPNDWDVCTSALPEETKAAFSRHQYKIVETGLKHGTVTVISENQPVEITTYRIDGEYEDSRRPKTVEFTRNLKEDLARRDFTINAMAYSPTKGLIDLYGGRDDLHKKRICCVGDPVKRFREDALRIMRGLRFAATLGFNIEESTAKAMDAERDGLENISKERINVELSKLIMGKCAEQIVTQYVDILETAAKGIKQPQMDINTLPPVLPVRLAEIFPKDTGKYLRLLKYDGNTIRWARVLSRINGTPAPIEPKKAMVRFLHKHGETITAMHYARAGEKELEALARLLAENPCYMMKDLAVSGKDLIEIGVNSGPRMGEILEYLLDLVIEEEVKNERNELLAAAKEAIKNE